MDSHPNQHFHQNLHFDQTEYFGEIVDLGANVDSEGLGGGGILGQPVWSDPSTESSPMSAETLRTPPARVGNVADCRIHSSWEGN